MFKKIKNENTKTVEVAINEIKKSNSFVLSTNGTIVIEGNVIDMMGDIVFLICQLLEKIPQEIKKDILSTLISELKKEDKISDESERLAQELLDKIKDLE